MTGEHELGGFGGRKGKMDNSGSGSAADAEAAFAKDFEHAVVVAEHVGFEFGDSHMSGDAAEMFEQNGADAAALMFVENGEGNFGARGVAAAHVAGHTDEAFIIAAPQRRHQTHMIAEVEIGETAEFFVIESALDAEKAVVNRLFAQSDR